MCEEHSYKTNQYEIIIRNPMHFILSCITFCAYFKLNFKSVYEKLEQKGQTHLFYSGKALQ